MLNVKELKAILGEIKIHFYTYWNKNKKRLLDLANEHKLLPEKSKDFKYDRLKNDQEEFEES